MSQPPDHNQPVVPAPDSESRRPDTGSLPLPYDQEPWHALPDQPAPLPDEAATRREKLSQPATPFGDQPTLAGRMITPQQQKRRPWPWALWLPPALVVGVLLAVFGMYVHATDQSTGTAATGHHGPHATVTSPATKSTAQGSASATARSTQPGSATVTASSTATPRPTATPVPGRFSVSPVTVTQKCSLAVLPLSPFSVTLSNQTASSVDFQVTVVTKLPGTSTPWASVSPASGSVSAGAQRQVVVTPNSTLCTDSLFHGTQPFVLRVTGSGTSGTFTVTDYVTSTV